MFYLDELFMFRYNIGFIQGQLVSSSGVQVGVMRAMSNSIEIERSVDFNISIKPRGIQ